MKKIRWNPTPGRVVVELITEERIGTLWVPGSAGEEKFMGKILEIGDDEPEGDEYKLKAGDTVVFGRTAGVRVEIDRAKVLIMHTREILAAPTWEEQDENNP